MAAAASAWKPVSESADLSAWKPVQENAPKSSSFVSGAVKGSALLTAASDPIAALKGLTGVDQVQNAMKSYDAGDHQMAAFKLLNWATSNPATRMADSLIDTSKDQFSKALKAYQGGDYAQAVAHLGAGTVPILAPAVNGTDLMLKASKQIMADHANQTFGSRAAAFANDPDAQEGAGMVAGNALDLAAPEVAGNAFEVAPKLATATKAAVKAGGADVGVGAAKIGGGLATAKLGTMVPGLNEVAGGIAGASLGAPMIAKGAAQVGRGFREGFIAGRDSIAAPAAGPTAPAVIPSTATSPNALAPVPAKPPLLNSAPLAPIVDLRVPSGTSQANKIARPAPAWQEMVQPDNPDAVDATPIVPDDRTLPSGRRVPEPGAFQNPIKQALARAELNGAAREAAIKRNPALAPPDDLQASAPAQSAPPSPRELAKAYMERAAPGEDGYVPNPHAAAIKDLKLVDHLRSVGVTGDVFEQAANASPTQRQAWSDSAGISPFSGDPTRIADVAELLRKAPPTTPLTAVREAEIIRNAVKDTGTTKPATTRSSKDLQKSLQKPGAAAAAEALRSALE